tara:strand:- start:1537 stop:2403 length:867 start_codon:yes stop_codon:yes gene_type:complete
MNIQEKIDYLKNNYNPYLILNVKRDDSNEKIESEFKRLILKTHPDRGGNSELFNLVKKAYNDIYYERKTNMGINNYNDFNSLKNEHINYKENQPKYENNSMSSRKFDKDRFNKIYDENRMNNLNDDGYGNWFKESVEINQPNNINEGNFNKSFNKYNNNLLQKFIIPEEIYAGNNLDCEELGIKNIDDFTKGFNINDNKLNYTDLKRALGGKEFIIDNTIKSEDRNIESYSSKRESCINEVNELENNYYKQKEIEDKNYESNRMISLHQMDTEIAEHFSKVNNLMISR